MIPKLARDLNSLHPMTDVTRKWFPTRWLIALLAVGLVDLVSTAVMHRMGLIRELNPIMKPIIEESEWLFALVKGGTLFGMWYIVHRFSKTHLKFIRQACMVGTGAYLILWVVWFTSGAK